MTLATHIPKHLNLAVRGMGQSATVEIDERSDRLRGQGREVFKLGLGQSPFPVPDSVVQALREHAAERDYLPTQGLPALREAVAGYTRRNEGLDVVPEDVLIGPGSKELMFLLQLVYYGDLVVPSPSWVSYEPQARILNRRVCWLSTDAVDGYRIDPAALDEFCAQDRGRPRLLILNYPGNPTGATYDAGWLEALCSVCREHGVLLLSDEIYGALHHDGAHVSAARFYPEGTIISEGLSKWCGAGGWRVGTFVFPPELRWLLEGMRAAASETYTSVCAPVQHAAITAFTGGPQIDDYLARARRVLKALGNRCHRTLVEAGIECVPPEGGFYLFPSFEPLRRRLSRRGIVTSAQLSERVLNETGVAFLPGSAFGRPESELSARLAYVDFDGTEALSWATTELDDAVLEATCSNVLEGFRRLARWCVTTSED